MKFIKKVKISRFRSFFNEPFECEEINIFSGANNAGKSSVLRALNLFFNSQTSFGQAYDHETDYNKAYTEGAGGKRAVEVRVFFEGQGGGALKKEFSISRQFFADADPSDYKFHSTDGDVDNKIKRGNGSIIRQFRFFINKFQYIYVPAVRDRVFLRSIFLLLEQVVNTKKEQAKYSLLLNKLTQELSKRTEDIGRDFESFIRLPTKVETPTSIGEILEGLTIQTTPGIKVKAKKKGQPQIEKQVGINASGDGIIMTYLPHFLSFLSHELTDKKFVWGFEEPENSLEYSRVQQLAEKFYSEFSLNAQIFLTTHSPAFISLRGRPRTRLFRVYKEELNPRKLSRITDLSKIADEIREKERQLNLFLKDGRPEAADTAKNELMLLERELGVVELSADIERFAVEQQQQKSASEQFFALRVVEMTKPLVIVESLTDEAILKAAYTALGGASVFGDFTIASVSNQRGQDSGVDAVRRVLRSHSHLSHATRLVGVFDMDSKGIQAFKTLGFDPVEDGICKKKIGETVSVGMLLPVSTDLLNEYAKPTGISVIPDYDFEIEDYFQPQFPNSFGKEIGLGRKKISDDKKTSFTKRFIERPGEIDFEVLRPLLERIARAVRA